MLSSINNETCENVSNCTVASIVANNLAFTIGIYTMQMRNKLSLALHTIKHAIILTLYLRQHTLDTKQVHSETYVRMYTT